MVINFKNFIMFNFRMSNGKDVLKAIPVLGVVIGILILFYGVYSAIPGKISYNLFIAGFIVLGASLVMAIIMGVKIPIRR